MQGTLLIQADGKCAATQEFAPVLGGPQMFVFDEKEPDIKYLVDTGAQCSVFPYRGSDRPSYEGLRGVDGRPVQGWGLVRKTVRLAGKDCIWSFRLARVPNAILGLDFLRRFAFIPDVVAGDLFYIIINHYSKKNYDT